jgi:hypothetical protein
LSHDEEIERLKDIGMETTNLNIVNNVIYNLSAYGHKSIPVITEIINTKSSSEIRTYGLETIEKIKLRRY